jgi:hypothetical protein
MRDNLRIPSWINQATPQSGNEHATSDNRSRAPAGSPEYGALGFKCRLVRRRLIGR